MCGILGGNNFKWNYEDGISSMIHRGPDGMQVKRYPGITLAFARLSIMDLSSRAMQPMDSEDNRVHLVFNGEIYGFRKLKEQLEKKYPFRTTSDTEVVLNAYLEYGDSFIDYVDGMFGIAIYDEREQNIKLFRDRSGIKPLYYYYDGSDFAFSSELKGITKACTGVKFQPDYTAFYDYLLYQYIPEPKSMYKNVYKLPPAYKLIYDVKKKTIVEKKRYWKLHVNTRAAQVRSREDIQEHLIHLIKKSVKEQMVADVPVGTFLSGGVDSSIITYEASRLNSNIEAFSIGFADKDYDEIPFVKLLTDQYGLKSNAEILNNQDLVKVKGSLQKWYDEPFADTSAYPTYLVSRLAKQKVTVVLTGDGGDELFGGYNRYGNFLEQKKGLKNKNPRIYKLLVLLKNKYHLTNQDFCDSYKTEIDLYAKLLGGNMDGIACDLAKQWKIDKDYEPLWHLYQYYNRELPPVTRLRYLDFKTYLPCDILTKVDRASMQLSLEARVPFLSRELIEFAFSLSEDECCMLGELKGCLKYAYEDIIPNKILFREKMGFGVPRDYLNKELSEQHMCAGVLKNEWPELYYLGNTNK